MDLLTDIVDYIVADTTISNAFTATPVKGTSIFISFEPDSPDDTITVYPYGGVPPEPHAKYKHNSSVQVRVRSSDFNVAYNTGQAIINQLHYNGNVCGSPIGMMYAKQSQPGYLTRDDELRSIVVCDFGVKYVRY